MKFPDLCSFKRKEIEIIKIFRSALEISLREFKRKGKRRWMKNTDGRRHGEGGGCGGKGAVMLQLTGSIVLDLGFHLESLGKLTYLTTSIGNSDLQ